MTLPGFDPDNPRLEDHMTHQAMIHGYVMSYYVIRGTRTYARAQEWLSQTGRDSANNFLVFSVLADALYWWQGPGADPERQEWVDRPLRLRWAQDPPVMPREMLSSLLPDMCTYHRYLRKIRWDAQLKAVGDDYIKAHPELRKYYYDGQYLMALLLYLLDGHYSFTDETRRLLAYARERGAVPTPMSTEAKLAAAAVAGLLLGTGSIAVGLYKRHRFRSRVRRRPRD